MATNKRGFLLLAGCFVLLLPTCFTAKIRELRALDGVAMTKRGTDDGALKLQKIVEQRNNASRMANHLIRERNALECANASAETSSTGGWCEKAVKTKHWTDDGLIDGLKDLLVGKHVASFGEGTGQYKLKLEGHVASFTAFDGAPFIEKFTNGLVKHLDLSIPQFGLPVYDCVLSLEVAEHIPAEFEDTFLGNIVRHAREWVILSWAVPGQGGHSHVNERSPEYVEAKMASLCFQLKRNESNQLKSKSSLWWFQRNVNVYGRKENDCDCVIDESMA